MAGLLIGSALITWVLCSALNSFVEFGAIENWFNRTRAFIAMILGVLLIGVLMVVWAWVLFPGSELAQQKLSAADVNSVAKNSCLVNLLVALGYSGFQLRRFWEED